jgi:hypothetical protein
VQHLALPISAGASDACVLEETRVRVTSGPVIDRAVGIMLAGHGKTDQQSISTLHELSDGSHVKVAVLGADLADEAAR